MRVFTSKKTTIIVAAGALLVGTGGWLYANGSLDLPMFGIRNTEAADKVENPRASQDADDETPGSETPQVRLTPEQSELVHFETALPLIETIDEVATFSGEVELNRDKLAQIVSPISGVVADVRKNMGDSVQRGDTLVTIESRELAESKAEYLAAVDRLRLANAAFVREESLWRKKISSEQEYLDAKQAAQEGRIAVRLAIQKLLALGLTQDDVDAVGDESAVESTRYAIKAPFDGQVIEKAVALGEQVRDASLFTVCDLSSIWVTATAYDKDIASIAIGQRATITVDAYSNQTFEGTVFWIADALDENTRTLPFRVVVDNSARLLKAGMFVNVAVGIGERPDALLVPVAAVQSNGEPFVFVEVESGTYERREVTVGLRIGELVEVSKGLDAGDTIVTRGAFNLASELGKSKFVDDD